MQESGGNKIVKLSKEGHIDWELKLLVVAFILCLNSFLNDYILFYYFCLSFFFFINTRIMMLNKYMRTAQPSGGRWSYDNATKKLFLYTYVMAMLIFAFQLYSVTYPLLATLSLLLAPTLSTISILEFRPCVMAINDKYPYLRELS